jgi:uncharacterized membrane protein
MFFLSFFQSSILLPPTTNVMFSIFKKKDFFTDDEKKRVVEAIRVEELRTTGEIRVFIEGRCDYSDASARAEEVFELLKMHQTKYRNAVLLYFAVYDQRFAIYADSGAYSCVTKQYWKEQAQNISSTFGAGQYTSGIVESVQAIGSLLAQKFPYEEEDKNELPDDIVFGKM